MIRTVILAACFCALICSPAQARHKHHFGVNKMVGCADPVMRPCATRHATHAQGTRRTEIRGGAHPARWCGWWLSRHLGKHDRRLWLAKNWAVVGRRAHGPAVGTVVVWRHHVGIITGRTSSGWIVLSGNDGGRVRERVRSVAGAIAFRWP